MWEIIITGMVLLAITLITIDRNKKKKEIARQKKELEEEKLLSVSQSAKEVVKSNAPLVTDSPLWISMRDEQLRNYRSSASATRSTPRPTKGNLKPPFRRPSPPSPMTRSSSKSRSSSGSSNIDTISDYTPSYSSTAYYDSGSSSSHHSDASPCSDFSGGGGDSGGGGSTGSWD